VSEIVFKKIPESDEREVRALISKVLGELERPEFFIPYADWELDSLFDESYALLDGAYIDGKLIGMAQLYVKQEMLEEFKQKMSISDKTVAEFGGNLILPEGRGQGIMFQMIKKQLEDAKRMGFDYVISMAHPDNIASLKSLQKLGMKYVNTCTVADGHLRDTYWIKLS
jgi:RimJ/RimL family protein N-acetyltransferase